MPHRSPDESTSVIEAGRDLRSEGPRLHVHLIDAGNTAPQQRCGHPRVGARRCYRLGSLRREHRGAGPWHVDPTAYLAGDSHDGLAHRRG